MRRGQIRDTSKHWTGGSILRTWDATCGCCLLVIHGEGAKSGASRDLRACGWRYEPGWVRVGTKDVKGWVCPNCLASYPALG